MNILIRNAGEVLTCSGAELPKSGSALSDLGIFRSANILISDGKFAFAGGEKELFKFMKNSGFDAVEEIDAAGKVVMPGFVDSHTHFVFAGSREGEYEMRLAGKTYQEIAVAGGGIMNTVSSVRSASESDLILHAQKTLKNFFVSGTTTLEGKSGYGLGKDSELKMLYVLNSLKKSNPFQLDIVPTFLGAHAVPPGIAKDDYVELLCSEVIPKVAENELADYIDIFIEKGYYDTSDAEKILSAGVLHGLVPRTHIDQFTSMGGTEVCLRYGAVSLDHLEVMTDADISLMSAHNSRASRKSLAGLLPGVSYFLGIPYAPARKLIDAGVPVLIATDFNPGSSMSENIQMMMSLASTQMKMTAEEIINSVTINPAYSLGMENLIGSIEVGKQADLLIFDMPSYKYLIYNFGVNNLEYVVKKGSLYKVNEIVKTS